MPTFLYTITMSKIQNMTVVRYREIAILNLKLIQFAALIMTGRKRAAGAAAAGGAGAAADASPKKPKNGAKEMNPVDDAAAEISTALGAEAPKAAEAPRPKLAKPAPPAPAHTDRQKAMEVNKRLTDAEARAAEAEKEKSLLEERMKQMEQLLRKKQEIGKGKNASEKQRKTNGQRRKSAVYVFICMPLYCWLMTRK